MILFTVIMLGIIAVGSKQLLVLIVPGIGFVVAFVVHKLLEALSE